MFSNLLIDILKLCHQCFENLNLPPTIRRTINSQWVLYIFFCLQLSSVYENHNKIYRTCIFSNFYRTHDSLKDNIIFFENNDYNLFISIILSSFISFMTRNFKVAKNCHDWAILLCKYSPFIFNFIHFSIVFHSTFISMNII